MTTSRERAFEQSTQHEGAEKRTVILVSLPVKPEARETFRKMLSEIGEHIAKEPSFVSALYNSPFSTRWFVIRRTRGVGSTT